MGIPIWSPQKQQHQHEHELLKRRLPSRQLLLQAALINQHPRHRSRLQQQRHSTAAESNDGYTRTHPLSPRPEASSQETQLAADRQMEQRFSEKKELLDQLKITTSLLDQFLSMGDLSSQGSALPPFITNGKHTLHITLYFLHLHEPNLILRSCSYLDSNISIIDYF
jgi:hypothetical protein